MNDEQEKLYAVKNDKGLFLLYSMDGIPLCRDKSAVERAAHAESGHVVTLIEEPEKVVLTKKQAEIVENARDEDFPATYISDSTNLAFSGEEDLLMKAYVNGYTVEKEKKYNVKDMFSHEVIATFGTYDEANNFMEDDKPEWWTVPAMTIVKVTDDDE